MAIEFKEGRFYLAMWYVDVPPPLHPPKGGNWMACAWHEESEPNKWIVDYRHRYYHKDEIGRVNFNGSKDSFHWYRIRYTGTEEGVINAMEKMIAILGVTTGEVPEIFWIRGDIHKFVERVQTDRPHWLHMQMVKEEDLSPEQRARFEAER